MKLFVHFSCTADKGSDARYRTDRGKHCLLLRSPQNYRILFRLVSFKISTNALKQSAFTVYFTKWNYLYPEQ